MKKIKSNGNILQATFWSVSSHFNASTLRTFAIQLPFKSFCGKRQTEFKGQFCVLRIDIKTKTPEINLANGITKRKELIMFVGKGKDVKIYIQY
jgi:hypothetical protein